MSDPVTGDIVAPPQNLEAEQCVLGAVLLSDTALGAIREAGLRPGHFYRHGYGAIYAAMCALADAGSAVDYVILSEHLKNTGQLAAIGGRAEIDLLSSSVPAVGHVLNYVQIVRDCAMWRRRLQASYRQIAAVEARDEDTYQQAREYGR